MLRLHFILIFSFFTITGFSLVEPPTPTSHPNPDTLSISTGDSTEYKILIVEAGYESWIATNAKPKWYYTNEFYRNKNYFYVTNWNNRVLETMHTSPYEESIEYNPNIDYGLDVNYQLYWYFQFMESKYNIKLQQSGKIR